MDFQDELSHLRRLDEICDEFEKNWSAGQLPDFSPYLSRVEPDERQEFVRQLLAVDVDLRMKAGEKVIADAYECVHFDAPKIVQAYLSSLAQGETIGHTGVNLDTAEINVDSIGPYALIKKIGEGGMGSVWLAQQHQPIRRRVALKLIKSGGGSKEVITRFDSERQALALMDHPNIARILDAGTTPDQRPFFAMELVHGLPLTKYCDEQKLGIDQRLRLFCDVCSGVQHAHQKGVIHRDLKPSNILVAQIDGRPIPKVIDFGLAKALENQERLSDQAQTTRVGQILGTLMYMSPEQASFNAIDIDTRTDIYSLGIILYQLLTGSTPLDDESIQSRSVLSVLQSIRDDDPVKPSTRLGNCDGEKLSTITQVRNTDRLHLKRILAGELDWIVMKSLEKDRVNRYESAADLAKDITRYLNDEAVEARPQSAGYRTRKFIKKNRMVVGALSAVAVSLILGIVFASWFAFQSNRSRNNENVAKQQAIKDRDAANRRLDLAIDAVETFYTNVAQQTIFNDPNAKDVIPQLLAEPVRFLQTIQQDLQQEESIQGRFRLARTNHLLFQLQTSFSNVVGSHQSLESAIELLEQLVSENPNEPAFLFELVDCEQDRFIHFMKSGNDVAKIRPEAHALLHRGLAHASRLVELLPDDQTARALKLQTHVQRAMMYREQDSEQAFEAEMKQAVALARDLVFEEITETGQRIDAASRYMDFAFMLYTVDNETAEELLTRVVEFFEDYLDNDPAHESIACSNLAEAMDRRAIVRRAINYKCDTLDEEKKIYELREAALELEPNNIEMKSQAARSAMGIARRYLEQRNADNAGQWSEKAATLLREVLQVDPGRIHALMMLQMAEQQRADVLLEAGKFEEAIKALEAVEAIESYHGGASGNANQVKIALAEASLGQDAQAHQRIEELGLKVPSEYLLLAVRAMIVCWAKGESAEAKEIYQFKTIELLGQVVELCNTGEGFEKTQSILNVLNASSDWKQSPGFQEVFDRFDSIRGELDQSP